MPDAMKRSVRSWVAVATMCLLAGAGLYAFAGKQPSDETAKPAGQKQDGEESPAKTLAKPIPDGSVDELLEFIADCQKRAQRANRNGDEDEFVSLLWTVSVAADKLLAEDVQLQERAVAASAKLQALSTLVTFRQPALKELRRFAADLANDEQADFARAGSSALLNADLLQVMTSAGEEFTAADARLLAEGVQRHLESKGQPDLSLAQKALRYIELSNDPTQAAAPYRKLAEVLEELAGEAAAEQVESYRKSAERVMLVGQPIEISGTLVDGTELDWNKFKGKVVLVDFWATWCGPCVEEIPNVIENYKRYHDLGFDVVGISADYERQDLESFLEDNDVPWPILFTDPDGSGNSNPMIEKFGVSSFPTLMLLGQDGKLIGFNARGKQLGRHLERLLGPAPEIDDDKDEPAAGR